MVPAHASPHSMFLTASRQPSASAIVAPVEITANSPGLNEMPGKRLAVARKAGIHFQQYWERRVHGITALGVEFYTSSPAQLRFLSEPGMQIHLRLNGSGKYRIDSGELVSGNSMECRLFFSQRAWEKQVFEPSSATNRTLVFGISMDAIAHYVEPAAFERLMRFDDEVASETFAVSDQLRQVAEDALSTGTSELDELVREARLLEVVAVCLRQVQQLALSVPMVRLRPGDREKIETVEQILKDNFRSPPSIPELAHAVALNTTKLKYAFKQIKGCTIGNYCRKLRLDSAARMLREDQDVGLAAYENGYEHIGNFARLFRDRFAMTPSEYRRSHRAQTEMAAAARHS